MGLAELFRKKGFVDGEYSRIDAIHPLNFYAGRSSNGNPEVRLLSFHKPPTIESSDFIAVEINKRDHDRKWLLSFTLQNLECEDIFIILMDDIIEYTRTFRNNSAGVLEVASRYHRWKRMLLKHPNGLLSDAEIKGLIGEMLFLRDFMIPKYGVSVAVASWCGPDKADQDFRTSDTWYEVKATSPGADIVRISSLEQLDVPMNGELAVVFLDKTSTEDNNGITLNRLYRQLTELLTDSNDLSLFESCLEKMDYIPRKEYDDKSFHFSEMARYAVDRTFPVLRRADIPSEIVESKYTLSLSGIERYLIKEQKDENRRIL